MTANPFADNTRKVRRAEQQSGLDIALVTDVPDDNDHQIVIESVTDVGGSRGAPPRSSDSSENSRDVRELETSGTPEVATVLTNGADVALPRRNQLVLVSRTVGELPIVVGSIHQPGQSPQYAAGERHVGAESGEGVFLHGPFATVPKRTTDDSDAPDGAVWYREDLGEYRGVEDGTVVTFDTTDV